MSYQTFFFKSLSQEKRWFFRFCCLLMLFFCALPAGCAKTFSALPADASRQTLPETPIKSMDETDRIIAVAQIRVNSAQGAYPLRAALILQRPSWLRLEILPLIGASDLFLTATPDKIQILIPSQGQLYSGAPTSKNLSRFIPWNYPVEDLVSIFTGVCPRLTGENIFLVRREENNLLRLEMLDSLGEHQLVWMEKNGRLKKIIRKDSDLKDVYQVDFDDYALEGPVAGRITIQMFQQKTDLLLQYSDIRLEKATDMSVFEMPVAQEIKIIELD